MELSVIIPVCDEAENLDELFARLSKVLMSMARTNCEIIFVDDGSTDTSYEKMVELHSKDKRVKVIKFTKNFGQHPALIAGLKASKGDRVVLLDADLQYPPEEIPKLVQKLDEGYDCVYANRPKSEKSAFRGFAVRIVLKVLGPIVGNLVSTQLTSFKIFNRELVDAILEHIHNSVILTGLSVWMGFSHVGIDIDRVPRVRGKSKYTKLRLISFLVELVTSFSIVPLRLTSYTGILLSIGAFLLAAFFLVKKLFWGIGVPGYASLIVTLSFFFGAQLLGLGVIGEYMARIARESQRRPAYIIREILG
jgi:glycosyltransferase involved in cell wall biosynthesis